MSLHRWPVPLPDPSSPRPTPDDGRNGSPEDGIDWKTWLRNIERKRRALRHEARAVARVLCPPFFAAATRASFELEGLHLGEREVGTALARAASGRMGRRLRSPWARRVRNHVAVLHHVETLVRRGRLLTPATVIRWYASIGCGLSTALLDGPTLNRLEQVVRQLNSPHLRLRPAVQEVARLHVQLLCDPFVPSFNGILARIMLHFHLGRCLLPPVVFDPQADRTVLRDEPRLLGRLLGRIEEGFGWFGDRPGAGV